MGHLKRILILVFLLGSSGAYAQKQALDGVLDLRGENLDRPLDMSGDWAFYWESYVEPQELDQVAAKRRLIAVPNN